MKSEKWKGEREAKFQNKLENEKGFSNISYFKKTKLDIFAQMKEWRIITSK